MYKIYILINNQLTKTYVGYTSNLDQRIYEHNIGKSKYTKVHGPWKVIYSENCSNIDSAIKKEKYFKSAAGRKKIKLILDGA